MHATTPSPRRWFRFSLRTLIILVTVCGAGLGWQLYKIRQRTAVLDWLKFRDATVLVEGEPGAFDTNKGFVGTNSVPWYRLLLGDQAVASIELKANVPPAAVARVERTFPEAGVQRREGGIPLSDDQYAGIKQKIAAQRATQARLRQEFVEGLTLPDLQAFFVHPELVARVRDLAPGLADDLEDTALLNVSVEVPAILASVNWLRTAAKLRERFGVLRQIPDARARAQALRAVNLELLRASIQADAPPESNASTSEFRELLIDYEIASLQDQPASDSDLSPAERRWHAAGMLGQRLCEAAQSALDEGAIKQEALIHSWERRRDARLAAADLRDDDDGRRAAWQQFADAVARRREIVEPLFQHGQPGGDAEKFYLLQDCAATAEAALARLDGDEAAEVSALSRAAENGPLLVEGTWAAWLTKTIAADEYFDAIGRSIDAQQRLAKLQPMAVDAQAWQTQQAKKLLQMTMMLTNACEPTIGAPYVACHYLLLRPSDSPVSAP